MNRFNYAGRIPNPATLSMQIVNIMDNTIDVTMMDFNTVSLTMNKLTLILMMFRKI